LVNYQEI